MNKFFINNKEDLRTLIVNTSRKKNISEAVIEKDYWVTFVLDYLFHENRWKKDFTFKGGTSLSKCFGLIERFSEDIDLILDWRVLGYREKEPWLKFSCGVGKGHIKTHLVQVHEVGCLFYRHVELCNAYRRALPRVLAF